MQKVGLGLIGAGAIGRVHAANIFSRIENAELVAIADVDQTAAKKLSSQSGNPKTYSDYGDLIADKGVNAVVACTPPFLKLDIVRRAAAAGKDVFCEKPIAVTLEEADEMVKVVEGSKTVFQVGYQRRFDPSYIRVRDAVASGQLGRLLLVREHNRDPPSPITGWSVNPKKSGGMFLDTTSHDFDAIRWLSGSEVTRVYAEADALVYDELRKNGDFDTTTVVMKLENGALAYVDSVYHTVYGFDARVEILGTEAAATVDMGETSYAHVLSSAGRSNESFDGYASRWSQAYRDEMADFAECVATKRSPRAGVRDGRAALEIGLAARESIEQKRAITLPRQAVP
ncbi:MAG TPA: Gfo/Idh/MocA family oxidoreductase [Nitrososphaerales archaeon]|nr:Gfo/Idh/MocA family oxidoreductase [Nitrososphaerales archaeon]